MNEVISGGKNADEVISLLRVGFEIKLGYLITF